jgi:predicted TIM-barrel fold metal-dependent hydrolase
VGAVFASATPSHCCWTTWQEEGTERWLSEFAELPLKEAVRPKILRRNAERILGLDSAGD